MWRKHVILQALYYTLTGWYFSNFLRSYLVQTLLDCHSVALVPFLFVISFEIIIVQYSWTSWFENAFAMVMQNQVK